MVAPINSGNATNVSREAIAQYLDILFGYVDFKGAHKGCVVIRGVGEKGTEQEGRFHAENIAIRGDLGMEYLTEKVFGHAERWGRHLVASFIVPAVMDIACLEAKAKAGETQVKFFTTFCMDIDRGNTGERLDHAIRHLGVPSLIVQSGGVTDTGAPKRHLYWRLQEPSADVQAVAAARKTLAIKLGGDTSFARLPQVIRIPGSIYAKGGVRKYCEIEGRGDAEYDASDFAAAINDMAAAPGITAIETAKHAIGFGNGTGLNFQAYHDGGGDRPKADVAKALTTDIHEGGDVDRNRWSEFGRVAGFEIRLAREGKIGLDEAREHTSTWASLHMIPLWPAERFEIEWRAMLRVDTDHHGPMPPPPNGRPVPFPLEKMTIEHWAVKNLLGKPAPEMKFLVEGLIAAGKPHLLVAPGGIGKTGLILDLGAKIAAHQPGDRATFAGLPLGEDAGGAVVIFTAEDDDNDIHGRLAEMDRDGLLGRAAARLYVVPLLNAGGSFELASRDRATGNTAMSPQWRAWLENLKRIPNLKLVAIDTLNSTMHGDENSATVVKEWARQLGPVLSDLGAAIIVTHHTRKPDPSKPIRTEEQMRAASRGSTAIDAHFRAIIGVWAAPDYETRMRDMKLEPKPDQLFNLSILKKNGKGFIDERRTLLRGPSGLLGDCTSPDQKATWGADKVRRAWAVRVVREAAMAGFPFTISGPNGLFERVERLPAPLKGMAKHAIRHMLNALDEDDEIVKCTIKQSKILSRLDIPGGPLARAVDPTSGAEYALAEGAWDVPNWHRVFVYSPTHGAVVTHEQYQNERVGRGVVPDSQAPLGNDGNLGTENPWWIGA